MHEILEHGITCIDTGYGRPGMAACYVILHHGEAAIIETGTALSVPVVLQTLAALNIATRQVRYVIPTHVHLDHAGGAGALLQHLPDASLVVHPRGARHLIDPRLLVAGAEKVYGVERVRELYGEIVAAPEQRVLTAEDGSSWDLGGRTLLVRDTAGHARHHFCVWDECSRGWFSGDTFGVCYRELSVAGKPCMLPTTTPVQFEPDALIASIELLMSHAPDYFYLTHFGRIPAAAAAAESLIDQIRDYVRIAIAYGNTDEDGLLLRAALCDYTVANLQRAGCDWGNQRLQSFLAPDMDLNAQGLMVWKRTRAKTLLA